MALTSLTRTELDRSPDVGSRRLSARRPPSRPSPQPVRPVQPLLPDLPPLETTVALRRRQLRFVIFTALPATLTSSIIHLLLLISLAAYALATLQPPRRETTIEVFQTAETNLDRPSETKSITPPTIAREEFEATLEFTEFRDEVTIEIVSAEVDPSLIELLTPPIEPVPMPVFEPLVRDDMLYAFASPPVPHRELAGRVQRRRQALAHGATMDSENAVNLALRWLVKHQRSDGSWSFQHDVGDHHCTVCACSAPGRPAAENGATGLVLLALLGAGHTPREGDYRESVTEGLRYLIARQTSSGSLMDSGGTMYSHALAALALCEALAMTGEQSPRSTAHYSSINLGQLADAAQRSLRFIEAAQHTHGGWRYTPNQPGDTSVLGWQLMALRSGHLAGLTMDLETVRRAVQFLDSVADDAIGSSYGYTHGRQLDEVLLDRASATTAIGLLGRMYTGWQRDHPGIQTGVDRLMHSARSNQGLYFSYYATQVLHHYGGVSWQLWNEQIRDDLIQQQQRRGPEAGSWLLNGPYDDAGRLYCTAMATLCLEVYYRYLPLYGSDAVPAAPLSTRSTRVGE